MKTPKRDVASETKALVGIERLLAPLSSIAQERVLSYFLSRVRDVDDLPISLLAHESAPGSPPLCLCGRPENAHDPVTGTLLATPGDGEPPCEGMVPKRDTAAV